MAHPDTEHGEPELADVISSQAGLAAEIPLKVYDSRIIDYSYNWNSKEVKTKKVQVTFLSLRADQYCLGIAKLKANNEAELRSLLERFKETTVWKCTKTKLLEEKTCYINTSCRVAIDLRKTVMVAMLQSPQHLIPKPESRTS